MRHSALWVRCILSTAGLLAACNDLGPCDDPLGGRTTVRSGPDIMYAGQAILLTSCASGCHSSKAKGKGRQGAPAGLDFDLTFLPPGQPVGPDGQPATADGGIAAVQVPSDQASALRARQRKVFEERENIWDQVAKGLMPPQDSFENTIAMAISRFMFGADGSCPASMGNFDGSKEALRQWLACGTPIVETNSSALPFVAVSPTSDAGAADKAAGALAYAGSVGYQFPACSIGGGDGGAGLTFDQIYTNVFRKPAYMCIGCHTGSMSIGGLDLSTADVAYMNLVGANGQGATTKCSVRTDVNNKRVMVKPSDPANSYMIALFGGSDAGPVCSLMPLLTDSTGLEPADLELVRQWIVAGAKR